MIKILVVDDDSIVRTFLMKLIINKFGYDVVQASNGVEALKVLDHDKPDIIFLDISMPVMNGIEFLATIRRNVKYKNLPVIAITAHSDKSTVKQLVDIGIQEFILKPLSYNETYARLREILSDQRQKIVAARSGQQNDKAKIIKRKKLLLNIHDRQFSLYLKQMLDYRYDVYISNSTAECLDMYVKYEPQIFINSLDCDPKNNAFLLSKLKELDITDELSILGLSYKPNPAYSEGYTNIIYKTYTPNKMFTELSKRLFSNPGISESYNELFSYFVKEIVPSIIKNVFNNYCSLGIIFKTEEEVKGTFVNSVNNLLVTDNENVCLNLALEAENKTDIRMLGDTEALPTKKVIKSLLTEISRNLQFMLEKFGLILNVTASLTQDPQYSTQVSNVICFETEKTDLLRLKIEYKLK